MYMLYSHCTKLSYIANHTISSICTHLEITHRHSMTSAMQCITVFGKSIVQLKQYILSLTIPY